MPTTFDFSDKRTLIVYANDEPDHNHAEEFGLWFERWVETMETAVTKFGVMLVNHAHEEDDDHDEDDHEHERNEAEENALTALITAFRREHKTRINQTTTGYASVYPGKMTEQQWEKANQRTAQFASYMFGVRGAMFKNKESAQAWLDEIANLEPLPLDEVGVGEATTNTAAIFYGSTTGSTELIAEKVQAQWQTAYEQTLPIVNVGNTSELMKLLSFDKLLIGIPTWNVGKLQDDWEIVYPYLDKVDLSGKTIAMFGVGDQYGYPENFQDALGILGRKLLERGATLIGYTSTAGYEHSYSIGVDGDQFMGLAIDDVNQPELTDQRIEAWLVQVKRAFEQEKAGKQLAR